MAKINLSNINVDATTLQGRDLYRITKDFWVVDASTAVDFNDRNLSTGFYHITADWVANLCTGLPANNAGMLINGHKGNQLFILYYNGDTFIRGAGTNTQTAWRKIAFSGGVNPYRSGYYNSRKGGKRHEGEYIGIDAPYGEGHRQRKRRNPQIRMVSPDLKRCRETRRGNALGRRLSDSDVFAELRHTSALLQLVQPRLHVLQDVERSHMERVATNQDLERVLGRKSGKGVVAA